MKLGDTMYKNISLLVLVLVISMLLSSCSVVENGDREFLEIMKSLNLVDYRISKPEFDDIYEILDSNQSHQSLCLNDMTKEFFIRYLDTIDEFGLSSLSSNEIDTLKNDIHDYFSYPFYPQIIIKAYTVNNNYKQLITYNGIDFVIYKIEDYKFVIEYNLKTDTFITVDTYQDIIYVEDVVYSNHENIISNIINNEYVSSNLINMYYDNEYIYYIYDINNQTLIEIYNYLDNKYFIMNTHLTSNGKYIVGITDQNDYQFSLEIKEFTGTATQLLDYIKDSNNIINIFSEKGNLSSYIEIIFQKYDDIPIVIFD